MALDKSVPFNQRTDTGRMGFRYDYEPIDERPCLVYLYPFWEPGEDVIWERAVKACPLREYGKLDVFRYLGEVAKLAISMDVNAGKYPVRSMPGRGMA